MKHRLALPLGLAATLASTALAGDFRASYYAGTPEGGWSQYELTTKDGTVATYTYERQPDVDGRVALSLHVQTTAGAAAGSESKMLYTMRENFDFAKDGMSYGKFIEKMTMIYGDTEMPVDDATLEVIRDNEKDYRGRVTPAGTEQVAGLPCARYTYSITSASGVDSGTLWLNDTVPFAIVRETGKSVGTDGTVSSEFDMVLKDRGQVVIATAEPEATVKTAPEPEPLTVGLVDGFQKGVIGLDVEALSGGRQLRINFRNEHDAQLTIDVPATPVNLNVDFPVRTLSIRFAKATRVVLEGGASSDAIVVTQLGTQGIAEGKCYLTVYEGQPLFQGSVTMDALPK